MTIRMRRDRITQEAYDDGEVLDLEPGHMLRRFRKVIDYIPHDSTGIKWIMDLGCREAFIVNHLWAAGHRFYTGVDLNEEAIRKAKARLEPEQRPDQTLRLLNANILDDEIVNMFPQHDFFIIMEVLEHMPWEYDIVALCNIPKDKMVAITIPIEPIIALTDVNRRNKEHVRGLDSIGRVNERYKFAFTNESYHIEAMKSPTCWFIFGIRNEKGFEDRT